MTSVSKRSFIQGSSAQADKLIRIGGLGISVSESDGKTILAELRSRRNRETDQKLLFGRPLVRFSGC